MLVDGVASGRTAFHHEPPTARILLPQRHMNRLYTVSLLALGLATTRVAHVHAQARPPAPPPVRAAPAAAPATTRAPAPTPGRRPTRRAIARADTADRPAARPAPRLAGRPVTPATADTAAATAGDSASAVAVTPPAGKPADWVTGLVRAPATMPAEDAAAAAVRRQAFGAGGVRVVVSLAERRLWYMHGRDTVFTAPVAVGKGTRLEYGSRAWRFATPRGVRRVLSKRPNPVWTPPEWHYAEIARDSGWAMARLQRGRPTPVREGGQLVVRGDRVVYQDGKGGEEIIPEDEEIIYGNTIYVPPEDTRNRRIPGELGAYALSMGDGYLLHGTPHKDSIGQAATHGCIRLGDADIEYLFRNVGVGTPVYIF